MKLKKQRSNCPINFGVEIFGDKWTLLIMRDILLFGKCYYNEFLTSEEKISTNILADRLNKLERQGLVRKQKDTKHGAKYIYTPNRKGIDLLPLLLEMILWSARHDPQTPVPPDVINRLEKDRTGVMHQMDKSRWQDLLFGLFR
jgi:DNA-binding HxlR family transcriptional regulator